VTETQHAFELVLPIKEKLSLNLHSRLRTEPPTRGIYQVRLGPIVTYRWKPKLSLIGGYYFGHQQAEDGDFVGGHRWFGGGESMLSRRPRWEMDTRALIERFGPRNASDFTRYRGRIRWSARGRIAPFTSQELLADQSGFRSVRLATGLRLQLSEQVQAEVSYFFEPRRRDVGPHRHMWATLLHFRQRR
jgi:hypothetical protein